MAILLSLWPIEIEVVCFCYSRLSVTLQIRYALIFETKNYVMHLWKILTNDSLGVSVLFMLAIIAYLNFGMTYLVY